MIVTIEKELFSSDDDTVKKILASLIHLAVENVFQWDIDNLYDIFFEDESILIEDHPFIKRFFSEYETNTIVGFLKTIVTYSGYITTDQRNYFSKIGIGSRDTEISPDVALRIFSLPSLIILENSINDWQIIKSICEKYEKKKSKKNIYRRIILAIRNKTLRASNAGGKNNIINIMKDLLENEYKGIYKFKLISIFDSDRINNSNDLPDDSKPIVSYFKNKPVNYYSEAFWEPQDVSLWHMLHKREFENYLPITVIQDILDLPEAISEYLKGLHPVDHDFIDIESKIPNVDVKKIFPSLFAAEFTRDLIETRCAHHLVNYDLPNQTVEQISEIELILLKLAKII